VITERGRLHGYNAGVQFRSASMVKAMLLVATLRRAADRPLTSRELDLLQPLITKSDNKAARKLYKTIGDAGLNEVAQAARMTRFLTVGTVFETRITAADQARFFLRIDRLVPPRHRDYARALLGGVIARQRWGIAPVATGRGFQILFKSGWRRGLTHQAALLERDGRRIALAVLTTHKPPLAYGQATLAGIATRVLDAAAGHDVAERHRDEGDDRRDLDRREPELELAERPHGD